MARSIPALVNPSLLVWAREEAGYSLKTAAEKIRMPLEKLGSWESGEAKPTLRQAEKMAKLYNRPFSVFCLPNPPQTTPLAAEYRRLPNVNPGSESPELRLAVRQMIYRRKIAIALSEELGDKLEDFSYNVSLYSNPEEMAGKLREKLDISVETQLAWSNEFIAWHAWRVAVEKLGVLVFQFGKVNLEEVRGLSLLEFPLPVIGINSSEIPASKPFSLIHELVHIMLANADEEKPALMEKRSEQAWAKVERFAEAVAGAVLAPADSLLNEEVIKHRATSSDWSIHEVRRLSRRYKMTPTAMITRLLFIKQCSPTAYRRWTLAWGEYLKEHPPKKGGGIATPSQKALNRNGRSFTRLVLEAFTLDRITSLNASRYLGLNFPHIENLRRDLAISGRFDAIYEGSKK